MEKQYWILRQGKAIGPFDGQQLVSMVRAGMVRREDMISADGDSWRKTEDAKDLLGHDLVFPQTALSTGLDSACPQLVVLPDPWQAPALTKGLAIASGVAGVAGCVFCWVLAAGLPLTILGVVMGGVAMFLAIRARSGFGLPAGSLAVCVIALLVTIVVGVLRQTPEHAAHRLSGGNSRGAQPVRSKPGQSPEPVNQPEVGGEAKLPKPNPVAEATKRAWDEMNNIDVSLALLPLDDPTAKLWSQNFHRYGQINMDNVDEKLREYITGWTEVCKQVCQLFQEFAAEVARLDKQVKDAADAAELVGSLDRDDPRRTALGARLLVGFLAHTGTKEQRKSLEAKYTTQLIEKCGVAVQLRIQRKKLSKAFLEKYRLPFDIRNEGPFKRDVDANK